MDLSIGCSLSSSSFSARDSLGSSMVSSSFKVANAFGKVIKTLSPVLHGKLVSTIQAQKRRIHASESIDPARALASADNVLTATFWIFFDDHAIGLIQLISFSMILLSAATVIMP